MPYKDLDMRRYVRRCSDRTRQYGNWRQIYYDQDGICQECGSVFHLEFHEIFGRKSPLTNETSIVLKCPACHANEHSDNLKGMIFGQYTYSGLADDIEMEMTRCGGLRGWVKKYKIVGGK